MAEEQKIVKKTIAVHLPEDMKQWLERKAEETMPSLNSYIVYILKQHIVREKSAERGETATDWVLMMTTLIDNIFMFNQSKSKDMDKFGEILHLAKKLKEDFLPELRSSRSYKYLLDELATIDLSFLPQQQKKNARDILNFL